MDIKWKNISRQLMMWIAVTIILVSTYFGIQSTCAIIEELRKGEKVIGTAFDFSDYFRGEKFEDSSSYDSYCFSILDTNIKKYLKDGTFGSVSDKEDVVNLNVDIEGTIKRKDKTKIQKIQYGDKITKKDKALGKGIFDVDAYVEKESGEYWDKEKETYRTSYEYYLQLTAHREKNDDYITTDTLYYNDPENPADLKNVKTMDLTIRIPKQQYQVAEDAWTSWMNACKNYARNMSIYVGVILVSLLTIIITASPKARSRFGTWTDGIWLEMLLFAFISIATGCVFCGAGIGALCMEDSGAYLVEWCIVGTLILELLCVYCFISIVRRIKEHKLLKSAVCYKALHFTKEALVHQKEEWDFWKNKQSSTLTKKEKEFIRKRRSLIVVGIAGVICTIWTLIIFFPMGIILGCAMVLLFKKLFQDYQRDIQDLLDLEKVLQQIYEISNGNLRAQTDIDKESLYYKATKDLESIGQGMEKSVEEQLKGERMKINLITNVSHDLKTPLTSIISYVDLLSKDKSLSAEARDYVAILERKSERLKNIVVDLFDLAKTTSGNADVDFSILDMRKLVEQTMVEMEDKIRDSGFEIVTEFETSQAHFEGDANRMYRVVQNVLENALKYSLKGSRIFIRIGGEDGKWKLTMKNTASYRMQFTEEEILERFFRGDKSRTTEGSGLGLSIAESFTRLCGGDFKVKIDGDQFTVEISFLKRS